VSDALRFADLEAEFAALRDAFGGLVVARHRGDDVVDLARAHARRRIAFGTRLAQAQASAAAGTERAGVASISSTLAWMDEVEPVDEAASGATGATAPEHATSADLRRRTVEAYGAAASAIRVGDEVVDRLTALGRLATEPDPVRRRAIFEALAPVWQAVDGDGGDVSSPYRELLRSSAATWARHGSPVEAAATALGLAPGSLEPALRAILAAWRAVLGPGTVEPWDYRYVVGAMERRLGPLVPRERLRSINDAHLASLGADPARLGIHYDVEPRPGRPVIPVAFTISEDVARPAFEGSWRAATPWVFATYTEGGLGNLEELIHESGHALHYAAIRARPAFFEPPVEAGGLVEGIADMLGWDVHEPAFQNRHLGASSDRRDSRLGRYGGVMLDVCWALFEIELHGNPDRRPNDAWAEITEAGLGIVPHPEWSWWAVRGQLVESPGYMANYALSAIVAAALRARIRAVRGDWQDGDPGWYDFVSEHLLRFGADRSPADVLGSFLGRTLDAKPLISDLTST
jgi:hypothetical protein